MNAFPLFLYNFLLGLIQWLSVWLKDAQCISFIWIKAAAIWLLRSFNLLNLSIKSKLHALKNLTFQFTPVTHMVYLEIRLHYLDFATEKLTSSNWISKYTMCVTGVNWKVKFLSACTRIQICKSNLSWPRIRWAVLWLIVGECRDSGSKVC